MPVEQLGAGQSRAARVLSTSATAVLVLLVAVTLIGVLLLLAVA